MSACINHRPLKFIKPSIYLRSKALAKPQCEVLGLQGQRRRIELPYHWLLVGPTRRAHHIWRHPSAKDPMGKEVDILEGTEAMFKFGEGTGSTLDGQASLVSPSPAQLNGQRGGPAMEVTVEEPAWQTCWPTSRNV